MRRRRPNQGLAAVLGPAAALALFASAAVVDAAVKLVIGPDGRKSVVQDGIGAPSYRRVPLRLSASPPDLEPLIERYAREFDLEEKLVRAVIQVESSYNPRALSIKGAMGLMQLMPETARELAVGDPWDPAQNVRGGSEYLSRMLGLFDGRLELALAAYNAGPSAVSRYGGVPPYPETRAYVEKVMRLYRGEVGYSLARYRLRSSARKTYLYRDSLGRLRMSTTPPSAR